MGRSTTKARVTNVAGTLVGYVDPLVKDEKLRQRLLDALAVGVAARRRAKRQMGVTSLARRLGSDPVLRDQVTELASHLRDARDHVKLQLPVKQAKTHRLRNTTLLLVGAGLVLASSPSLRDRVAEKVKSLFGGHDEPPFGGHDSAPAFGEPKAPSPDVVNTNVVDADDSVGPNAPA